jgi:CBS domain-containing protein
MTRDVQVVRPEASLFEAASMMKRFDVGALPVCDGKRLQGMLTDRDLVVRAVADSRDPQLASVRDAMTAEVVYAYDDDSVEHGARLMREHQIRRLPIVDRQKNLVGIISLGDLAVDTGDERLSGTTLERVSEPGRPRR